MLITNRQNSTSRCPPVLIKTQIVEETDSHKVLGVIIDNNLSWTNHVTALCRTISKKVYQISKIKHFLNLHARKLFLHARIQSIIDYGSTLWDSVSANTLKPSAILHRGVLEVVLLKNTTVSTSDYKHLAILSQGSDDAKNHVRESPTCYYC